MAAATPIDDLGGGDVRGAVAAIERGNDPDALFAAARACEDKLHDPSRALAIYQWILRVAPDSRVAPAAEKRAAKLREIIGASGEHADQAAALAKLVEEADRVPVADVIARGDALAAAPWPGAPDAALWLGEWLRRTGHYEAAQVRYAQVIARWPGSDPAARAQRDAAGAAIDAHAWSRAEQLAAAVEDPEVRGELLAAAARGRARDRWYALAWLGLALALVGLGASLAEAVLRGGRTRPSLAPPIEVMFLAPIAAVLTAVSFTAHRAIAPAVLRISIVGVLAAWVSGVALDLLRSRDRPVRARAIAHVIACAVAVVSMGYIAMTRDGLLDMLAETVKFGPGA